MGTKKRVHIIAKADSSVAVVVEGSDDGRSHRTPLEFFHRVRIYNRLCFVDLEQRVQRIAGNWCRNTVSHPSEDDPITEVLVLLGDVSGTYFDNNEGVSWYAATFPFPGVTSSDMHLLIIQLQQQAEQAGRIGR